MFPKWVAITSYLASALLLWFASFTGSIVVRTTQPNGLAEIQFAYSGVSFFATLAGLGVLFFGITLSLAILRGRTAKPGRPFLGSGILSAGVVAILFAAYWSLVNWQDDVPRCLGGCPPSTLQYYQTVYAASIILAVLGLVAAGFGAWLLVRRTNVRQESSEESGSETSSHLLPEFQASAPYMKTRP